MNHTSEVPNRRG